MLAYITEQQDFQVNSEGLGLPGLEREQELLGEYGFLSRT